MHTFARSADHADILQRLARLTPESRRLWGRMSPHQVVCHLSDSYKVVIGERPVAGSPTLLGRTLIRFIALSTPMAWPKGTPTMKEVDQDFGGTRPEEFTRDMSELGALIERVAATPRDFTWASHPLFGPLTEREWLHWAWRHPDHHLRQFGL